MRLACWPAGLAIRNYSSHIKVVRSLEKNIYYWQYLQETPTDCSQSSRYCAPSVGHSGKTRGSFTIYRLVPSLDLIILKRADQVFDQCDVALHLYHILWCNTPWRSSTYISDLSITFLGVVCYLLSGKIYLGLLLLENLQYFEFQSIGNNNFIPVLTSAAVFTLQHNILKWSVTFMRMNITQ